MTACFSVNILLIGCLKTKDTLQPLLTIVGGVTYQCIKPFQRASAAQLCGDISSTDNAPADF